MKVDLEDAIFTGVLLIILTVVITGVTISSVESNDWQKAIVAHGYGSFVHDENNNTTFKWKENIEKDDKGSEKHK